MNAPPRQDKFRVYRQRKRAAGLREIRRWVPDVHSREFRSQLDAQIDRINSAEDAREVMIFCDHAAAEMWDDLD